MFKRPDVKNSISIQKACTHAQYNTDCDSNDFIHFYNPIKFLGVSGMKMVIKNTRSIDDLLIKIDKYIEQHEQG